MIQTKMKKRSVKDLRNIGFMGWAKLISLCNETQNTPYYVRPNRLYSDSIRLEMAEKLRQRDRDLIATLFLTGTRISECLMLRKQNFNIQPDMIICENFPLLKRYKLVKTLKTTLNEIPKTPQQRKKYQYDPKEGNFKLYDKSVHPLIVKRNKFVIPRWEPLTEHLIERVESSDNWLFPSPKNPYRTECKGIENWLNNFELEARSWIAPTRSYQILTDLGKRTSLELWNHRLRSERASQLARDYLFQENHLNSFFGWTTFSRLRSMAGLYTGISPASLEDQMILNHSRFETLYKRDMDRWR